jgi:hypothetical protein
MSFNELNAVEHFIIQKLSGKNLNAADPTSSVAKDDEAVYGSFPWKYQSAGTSQSISRRRWSRTASRRCW